MKMMRVTLKVPTKIEKISNKNIKSDIRLETESESYMFSPSVGYILLKHDH